MLERIERMANAWEAMCRAVERQSYAMVNHLERQARIADENAEKSARILIEIEVLRAQVRSLQLVMSRGIPKATDDSGKDKENG